MPWVTFRGPDREVRVGELDLGGETIHELRTASMLELLDSGGARPTGERFASADCVLLAPVPEPPSVRDFYAYEGHVAAGWARRGQPIPEYWYQAPVFYFSNPASIHAPGQPVTRPSGTAMLDFELEIAAVIGAGGEIAGFTLMNDWSARDVQRREVTVGLGPHKAKDFATSLGPWLARPDELPYHDGRLQLEATVTVNGETIGGGDAAAARFTWPELVAHAARDTRLRPGDVLGSGTLERGCLLELGPLPGERWLEPGDVVALHAPGLGTLETAIAEI
jgi:fumarylacetoacetate (FAA) hydrolase